MASGQYGAVVRQINRLFGPGTVAGMSEWQLLHRYITRRDEAAFEALVARHGPMVMGVCRRVLGDAADVEDAFQATFLVLVKKAGTLGEHDAVGHWLYGVACRVALHARSDAARRRARERSGAASEIVSGTAENDASRREIGPVLDEELARLPTKYRAPIVLCYVEGLSHEEAARQLQWPVGTVKGRLSRARDLLQGRLTRRGLAPASGAIATALARDARAAVPPALTIATTRAALAIAEGGKTAGVVSAVSAALMEGVITTMSMTRIKLGLAALLVLGTGAGLMAYQASDGPKDKPTGKASPLPATKAAPVPSGGTNGPAAEHRKDLSEERIKRYGKAVDLLERDPKTKSILTKLEERVTMSFPNETPLEDILNYIKSASSGPNDDGIPIYVDPAGLQEAGKTISSRVTLDVEGAPLKETVHLLLRPLGLDYQVADGLLKISSRNAILEREIEELREELKRVSEQLKAAQRRPIPPPQAPVSGVGTRDSQDPKSQAILKKLEEPVAMSFANETPLEDVLKYIKSATAGPNDTGIPIYVDPVGLQETEKTMTSPISIDLEGVPLKTTLTLLLKQLGLCHKVKDGLLIITNISSEDDSPLLELEDKAERGELTPEETEKLLGMLKVLIQVDELKKKSREATKDMRAMQDTGSVPRSRQ